MEKKLLFTDQQAINMDLEKVRKINSELAALADEFRKLPLELTPERFSQLVKEGAAPIVAQYFQELTEKSNLPDHILSVVIDQYNLKKYEQPINRIVKQVIRLCGEISISPDMISFSANRVPVIMESEVLPQIEEAHRFYAEGPEELELLKKIEAFCKTANALESFLIEHDLHTVFTDRQFFEIWGYCHAVEEEGRQTLTVNPITFSYLRTAKAIEARKKQR